MNFYSVSLISANENGDREVHFVMHRSWIDKLLCRPATEHRFVQHHSGITAWYEKGSGRKANALWEQACLDVVEFTRQMGT